MTSKAEYEHWLTTLSPEDRAAHLDKQRRKDTRRNQEQKAARQKWTEAGIPAHLGNRIAKKRYQKKKRYEEDKKNRIVARCPTCGRTAELTKDHIKPRSRGGTNHPDNIQWICGPCNWEKSDSETWVPPLKRRMGGTLYDS